MNKSFRAWAVAWCCVAACSQDVSTGSRCKANASNCTVNARDDGGAAGGFAGSGSGSSGSGAIGSADNALTVHVEDVQKMTIEIITLACAGDCADIEAVAHGGHEPYAFTWDDGSKSAKRHVCLDASAKLDVSVTDTAITTDEFRYDAKTVHAEVTANVLECSDAAVPMGEGACVSNPSIEGTPGFALPPEWAACSPVPEILPIPGSGSIAPASDGATYLGLGASSGPMSETAGNTLCTPLAPGVSLPFSVDLALSSQNTGASVQAVLQIWGGSASCDKAELLWTSPSIAKYDTWRSYCGTLTPSKAYTHLVLVPVGEAYVMIDNLAARSDCL